MYLSKIKVGYKTGRGGAKHETVLGGFGNCPLMLSFTAPPIELVIKIWSKTSLHFMSL